MKATTSTAHLMMSWNSKKWTAGAGTSSFGCHDAADWHHLLGTPYIVRTTAGLF